MRDTAGSTAVPAARRRNRRRGCGPSTRRSLLRGVAGRRGLPNRGLHDFPPTLVMPVQITIISRCVARGRMAAHGTRGASLPCPRSPEGKDRMLGACYAALDSIPRARGASPFPSLAAHFGSRAVLWRTSPAQPQMGRTRAAASRCGLPAVDAGEQDHACGAAAPTCRSPVMPTCDSSPRDERRQFRKPEMQSRDCYVIAGAQVPLRRFV